MTMLIPEDLVREAARAPSAHNIQPARWRFGDGRVTLFHALDRTLPVADASGHDLQASLGAAWEGMSIALSARGFELGSPGESHETATGCVTVATATVAQSGVAPDPLASFVTMRRSFRGKFEAVTPDDARSLDFIAGAADVFVTWDRAMLDFLALAHDDATWAFESQPEYHAELWQWLRLSKSDPRYARDGLNGDCLALSAPERWAAARLLEPRTFERLKATGIARRLVSESAQVKSASAAIVFAPRADLPAFDVGRRMYRLWLEITAAGFYLAPMSASADHIATRAHLARSFNVPGDRRVANVFRVGRKKASEIAISPRLPVAELLV